MGRDYSSSQAWDAVQDLPMRTGGKETFQAIEQSEHHMGAAASSVCLRKSGNTDWLGQIDRL